MHIISEETAHAIVKPYIDDLLFVVRRAWADWLVNPIAGQMQDPRTRATLMWNQWIFHAKARFDGNPSVRVETLRYWDGVSIDSKVFIRMKKAENSLLSRNYPTRSAAAFHDQIQDLFGGVARLELVYVLSKDNTELERVVLIQRHNKQVLWTLALVGDDNAMAQEVFPFAPLGPQGSGGDVARRVIKRKKDEAQTDGTQDGSAAGGNI